jgi:two-component system, NarL family, response regulator LiaR
MQESISSKVNANRTKTIKIILADDHPLMRQALRTLLEKQSDFEIIGEACDGEEAASLAMKLNPHVVIMDISMPKLNGLEATRQIKAKAPSIAVLVLTVHSDSEHILSILHAGASGYLIKSVYGEDVTRSVRMIAAGETVIPPAVSQQILKYAFQYIDTSSKTEMSERFSSREMDVLRLVAKGMSNRDIAIKLGLSLRTVKGHLTDLFSKLNVASRTEAVIVGLRKGILTIDDINEKGLSQSQ